MVDLEQSKIRKAILKSQHCQRNWDLNRQITESDLEILMTSVSQCPSKQNVAYYRAHFILDRELIEKIHSKTNGFITNFETGDSVTNSQTLANLLVVFEVKKIEIENDVDALRNESLFKMSQGAIEENQEISSVIARDRNMAIGIAAGYLNLTSNILGFSTGCCACFDENEIKEILSLDESPALLMGIGFSNEGVSRRLHHIDRTFVFPTKLKQKIDVFIYQNEKKSSQF